MCDSCTQLSHGLGTRSSNQRGKLREAILKAFKSGNISFVQVQENEESDVLTIVVKLQATDFKAKSKGPDADHPQKPNELTEEQLLNSILKNTYQ